MRHKRDTDFHFSFFTGLLLPTAALGLTDDGDGLRVGSVRSGSLRSGDWLEFFFSFLTFSFGFLPRAQGCSTVEKRDYDRGVMVKVLKTRR